MDNGHPPTDARASTEWSAGLARFARLPRGSSRGFLLVVIAIVFGLMTVGLLLAVFSTPGSNRTGDLSSAGNGASVGAGRSSATSRAPATAAPSGRATSSFPACPASPRPRSTRAPWPSSTWPATLGHQMSHWAAGPGGATLEPTRKRARSGDADRRAEAVRPDEAGLRDADRGDQRRARRATPSRTTSSRDRTSGRSRGSARLHPIAKRRYPFIPTVMRPRIPS